MATLENAFSTWGNSRVQLFLSTRWCISLSLVAFGHSWYEEMHQLVLRKSWTLELPHVEKIHFFVNFHLNILNFGIQNWLIVLLNFWKYSKVSSLGINVIKPVGRCPTFDFEWECIIIFCLGSESYYDVFHNPSCYNSILITTWLKAKWESAL